MGTLYARDSDCNKSSELTKWTVSSVSSGGAVLWSSVRLGVIESSYGGGGDSGLPVMFLDDVVFV